MSSYKKLNANDIKIIPFEAHKRYSINNTNTGSFKASIHSASWTGSNKANFNEEHRKYYQLDHLFYKDYITNLGNKLDISDTPYTYQERRLYEKAKVLSLSQTTFGSSIQPNTFSITGSFSGSNTKILDDGYGNLIDNIQDYSFTQSEVISPSLALVIPTIATGSLFSVRIVENGSVVATITSFSIADFSNPNNALYTGSTIQGIANFLNYEFPHLSASIYNGALQISSSLGASYNGNLVLTGSFGGSYGTGSVFAGGVTNVTSISASVGSNNFIDERKRVFYLAPINGFKKTNLKVDYTTGEANPNHLNKKTFTDGEFYDDSYYLNKLSYNGISFINQAPNISSHPKPFKKGTYTFMYPANSGIVNNSTPSGEYIEVDHTNNFIFDDFAVVIHTFFNTGNLVNYLNTFGTTTVNKNSIINKNGEIPRVKSNLKGNSGLDLSTSITGSNQKEYTPASPNYPFDIYFDDTNFSVANYATDIYSAGKLIFKRSDGKATSIVSASFLNNNELLGAYTFFGSHQYIFQKSGSYMQIWRDGIKIEEVEDLTNSQQCNNISPLYLFNNGVNGGLSEALSRAFPFGMSQIMIYNQALNQSQIASLFSSITGTPTIGNIFYDTGLAVITHPDYQHVFADDPDDTWSVNYRNTHLIYEHEISCTVQEDEFNFTNNLTARTSKYPYIENLANFATGSNFKPYVTTIGLYNDEGELLVVGKLGQPTRMSDETDTTFIIRYDT